MPGPQNKLGSPNPTSSAQIRKLGSIRFGILSATQIEKMSVVKVENPEIYDPNGNPNQGGINDLRMGTCDRTRLCKTCNSDTVTCPGHFGHINLARPVFHINFIDYCIRVLRCICYNCSKIRANPQDAKLKEVERTKNPRRKLALMGKICTTIRRCSAPTQERGLIQNDRTGQKQGCGFCQPKIKRAGVKIWIEFDPNQQNEAMPEKKFVLSAGKCKEIFERISDEDCLQMGFNPECTRPENFIITKLPVAPPSVRPSVAMDSIQRCQDDLTFQYNQILKANRDLIKQTKRQSPDHVLDQFQQVLQHYVFTLMDNDIPNHPASMHKSGKKIKSITARLRGKEGRLRGNLMGKRVDFSARAVITPDPNLSLDQLGVPKSIAINLTFPQLVTPLNYWKLKSRIANGPVQYPGAKLIRRPDGVTIDLRFVKRREDVHLEYGYQVERHIQTGDLVLFNRQPSLHRMSIMGHRVRILPFSTFRLNLSVTTPYNADFDGDEMNMHVPQSLETKAEIKQIIAVHNQIITPQSNKPCMGIVQDTLVGIYLFTRRDTFLDKYLVMNLLMSIPKWNGKVPQPAVLKPKPLWTGKQIMSQIFPLINCRKGRSDDPLNEKDSLILIQKGRLLMGQLDNSVVGRGSGGVIHIIQNEHGPLETNRFLSVTQRVVNRWLQQHGFTVGISDTIADKQTLGRIRQTLAGAKVRVNDLINVVQDGKLQGQPGKNMMESFEQKANKELNDARDEAGQAAKKHLDPKNNIKAMVNAGSKGKDINLLQIMACVGQQNVQGRRIPFGFKRRALPHFTRDDYGPQSRGFVYNSYISGLTPDEFFYHAMGGRQGLIDTAVKTSETGYIQRRLIKALQGVMVNYDRTVRTPQGSIVQFLYGQDGIAGEKIQDINIDFVDMGDEVLEAKFNFLVPPKKKRQEDFLLDIYGQQQIDTVNRIIDDPQLQITLQNEYESIKKARDEIRALYPNWDSQQHFPVNMSRLIWNAQQYFNINKRKSKSDLLPNQVIQQYDKLITHLIIVPGSDEVSHEAQKNAIYLFSRVLRSFISSKRIIAQERLNRQAFKWLIGEIQNIFSKAQVQSGEMVGVIAAQSLGEPATQMTLNTFHLAGVSSKNVTLGVPRLKQVINVASKIKTPSLTVYLQQDRCFDWNLTKEIQAFLEHTTLSHVVSSVSIIYDPDPKHTILQEDKLFVDIAYQLEQQDLIGKFSPWVLRFQLNHDKIIDKQLEMDEIQQKIECAYESKLESIVSDDNSEKLVLRVRVNEKEKAKLFNNQQVAEVEYLKYLKQLQYDLLHSMSLKGFPEIKKVFARKGFRAQVNPTNGNLEKNNQYIIETDGVALQKVLGVPGINHKRTVSNDVREMHQVLGIQAVRASLLNELRAVLSFYGIYVNYRHLATLCDVMTHRGVLMAIQRHGIHKAESGPLHKASFERTVEVLMQSGVFSDKDDLTGISQNVMVGQLAPLGTGSFDLLVDAKKLDKGQQMQGTNEMENATLQMEDFGGGGFMTPRQGSGQEAKMGGNTPMAAATPGQAAFTPGGMTPHSANPGTFSPGIPQNIPILSPKYNPAVRSPLYNSSQANDGFMGFGAGSGGGMSPTYSPTNTNFYSSKKQQAARMSPAYMGKGQFTPAAIGQSPSYGNSMNIGAITPGTSGQPSTLRSPAYYGGGFASPAYSPTNQLTTSGKSPTYRVDIKHSFPSSSASLGYETSKSPKYVPRSSSNIGASPAYSPSAGFNMSDSPAAIATGNTGSVVLSPAVSGASYSPSGSGAGGGALSSAHGNLVSPAYNPLLSPAYNPLSATSPVYGSHRSPAYNPTASTSQKGSNMSAGFSPTVSDEQDFNDSGDQDEKNNQ